MQNKKQNKRNGKTLQPYDDAPTVACGHFIEIELERVYRKARRIMPSHQADALFLQWFLVQRLRRQLSRRLRYR